MNMMSVRYDVGMHGLFEYQKSINKKLCMTTDWPMGEAQKQYRITNRHSAVTQSTLALPSPSTQFASTDVHCRYVPSCIHPAAAYTSRRLLATLYALPRPLGNMPRRASTGLHAHLFPPRARGGDIGAVRTGSAFFALQPYTIIHHDSRRPTPHAHIVKSSRRET